jgi:hypothetical protein
MTNIFHDVILHWRENMLKRAWCAVGDTGFVVATRGTIIWISIKKAFSLVKKFISRRSKKEKLILLLILGAIKLIQMALVGHIILKFW